MSSNSFRKKDVFLTDYRNTYCLDCRYRTGLLFMHCTVRSDKGIWPAINYKTVANCALKSAFKKRLG